mmetsp:Transcript_91560/g.296429  ORF Transcript_91560/g.296429 Transcript_91560/m.296429 type:complete len:220 (+) Transcript_91560:1186-1845(+)
MCWGSFGWLNRAFTEVEGRLSSLPALSPAALSPLVRFFNLPIGSSGVRSSGSSCSSCGNTCASRSAGNAVARAPPAAAPAALPRLRLLRRSRHRLRPRSWRHQHQRRCGSCCRRSRRRRHRGEGGGRKRSAQCSEDLAGVRPPSGRAEAAAHHGGLEAQVGGVGHLSTDLQIVQKDPRLRFAHEQVEEQNTVGEHVKGKGRVRVIHGGGISTFAADLPR